MKAIVTPVTRQGLGIGDGKISRKTRLETGDIKEKELDAARELIADSMSYPLVEFGDDGCGDGRGTTTIYEVSRSSGMVGQLVKHSRNGHRSKVFGGGLIMAWIMDRVLRGPAVKGETVFGDRQAVAAKLHEQGVVFGGHTDTHASGTNSGCGAIDRSPEILAACAKFREEIKTGVQLLIGLQFNETIFDEVMDQIIDLSKDKAYLKDAEGSRTKELLEQSHAMIKELEGTHNEVFLIVNYVAGTTFNQSLLNAKTESSLQAFVVDAWRIDEYSDVVSSWHYTAKDATLKALTAGFIYTLATSCVLTDGSQEVYIHRPIGYLEPLL